MASRTKDYKINENEVLYMIEEDNTEAKDYMYEKYHNLIQSEIQKVKKSAYALHIDYSDLVQEALLGFSSALYTYNQREDVKFSTYAILIVRRRLLNCIKKARTSKSYILNNTVSFDNDVCSYDTNILLKDMSGKEPLNKIVTDEELKEVNKKFHIDLTQEERQVLDLTLDGLKPSDIADILDITDKKVYNVLYRARKKLKN